LWVRRLWDALYGNLPKLTAMQQADVYRHLRRGARPDVDFFIMMGLAAIIASMGLLYNSPAVIIGAMLVAPLFTPIVAISLAIVRGDARLLALATESTVKGLALAIGLGTMLAWLSPQATVTAEISVRAHPALPDLIVALASGAAGAYAIARKDVAASLPGVGIAAALVPPLCAVGIGLSIGDATVVSGAGLLFVTNLVAITLAGALMLMLLGFQAGQRRQAERALRQGLLATLALVVAVSIPLAAVFVRSLRQSQMTAVARDVLDRTTLVAGDVEWANLELLDQRNEIVVSATLYAPEMVSPEVVEQLSADLSGRLGRPTRLRLATIVVTERTYPPPG